MKPLAPIGFRGGVDAVEVRRRRRCEEGAAVMGPRRGEPSAGSTARAATQPSAPPLPGRRTRYQRAVAAHDFQFVAFGHGPLTLPVSEQVSRSGVLSDVTRTRSHHPAKRTAGASVPPRASPSPCAHAITPRANDTLIDRFIVAALIAAAPVRAAWLAHRSGRRRNRCRVPPCPGPSRNDGWPLRRSRDS